MDPLGGALRPPTPARIESTAAGPLAAPTDDVRLGERAGLTDAQAAAAVFHARPEDLRLSWRFKADGDSCADPSVAPDGSVLFSDGHRLHKLRPDGTTDWIRANKQWTPFRPAATNDGGAVWSPGGSQLVAFDPLGNEQWRWGDGVEVQSIQPTVAADGTIFCCVREHKGPALMVALSPQGHEAWRAPLPVHASAPPLPDGEGGVIVRGDDDRVIALRAGGGVRWDCPLPERLSGRPTLTDDGAVWIGNDQGELYRISADGKPERLFQARAAVRGAPFVSGGRVYLTSQDRHLYALDTKGHELWQRDVGEILEEPPMVLQDGRVLVSGGRSVHAYDAAGEHLWNFALDGPVSRLALDRRGGAVAAGGVDVVRVRGEGEAPLLPPPAREKAPVRVEDGWIVVDGVRIPRRSPA